MPTCGIPQSFILPAALQSRGKQVAGGDPLTSVPLYNARSARSHDTSKVLYNTFTVNIRHFHFHFDYKAYPEAVVLIAHAFQLSALSLLHVLYMHR